MQLQQHPVPIEVELLEKIDEMAHQSGQQPGTEHGTRSSGSGTLGLVKLLALGCAAALGKSGHLEIWESRDLKISNPKQSPSLQSRGGENNPRNESSQNENPSCPKCSQGFD